MSNNAPDYENDLVFPPQEIKSQDDLNRDDGAGRTMTLLRVIEQLEKTEVELEKVEKKLKIAVDMLEIISTHTIIPDEDTVEQVGMVYNWSSEALNQIEELDK
jgi:hypothetical protein